MQEPGPWDLSPGQKPVGYDFTLRFSIDSDPSDYIDLLSENCTDAIIGVGQEGKIALNFCRQSSTLEKLSASALAVRDVKSVIPNAELIKGK